MSTAPARSRASLAAWLMGGFALVLGIVAITAFLVARSLGPPAFERRMDRMHRGMAPPGVDVDEAFRASTALAFGLALLVAVAAAAAVSLAIARRMSRSLGAVSGAARRVADGELAAKVPAPGMGRELDELAESFNVMTERLDRSERLRARLIGDVAHELRTPVATIGATLDALEDGVATLTPDTVAVLRDQAARLTRLSADLSAVTRAESGEERLSLEPHDPAALVRRVAASWREAAAAADVALVEHLADGLPLVNVDPDRMDQVLGNLVDNALRHTPAGGTVTVGTRAAEHGVALVVEDSGSGIAPEHLPHVLERFYRADPGRDRGRGGSGIGLAIVRALVDAHGGTVRVDSPGVGRGTTATVTLPAASGVSRRP